jgi:hypothetical protein
MMRLERELAVYRVAQEIEMVRAQTECKAARRRDGPTLTWEYYYDPHAAHLLGELILSRIAPAYRGPRSTPATSAEVSST